MATNNTHAKRERSGAFLGKAKRSRVEPEVAGSASVLLVLLANKLSSGASVAYRDAFGVGTVEWRILAHVATERWISPQHICLLAGLDKGGVSRSMRVLLDRGLIAIRGSETDARSVEVALTAKGRALHDRIARVADTRERRLLSGLSRQEIRNLVETLRRLHERLASLDDPAGREDRGPASTRE